MKAFRYFSYGPPEVLQLQDVGMPTVGDDDILVRVRAVSVNPLDWHFMRGTPYFMRLMAGLSRPKANELGADFAGEVEAVGKNVTELRPGDEVYGTHEGTFAEYVTVPRTKAIERKPAGLTFEQAASVPCAGLTALQGLRKAGLAAGQKVLVNGAGGGVGTFTVQIAKALGAEVTGVCGSGNVAMVGSIGAAHVVDYTKEDVTRSGRRYDLVMDLVGNLTVSGARRALTPKGTFVAIGPRKGQWIGPLIGVLKLLLLSPLVSQRMLTVLARPSQADLVALRELLESGQVTPVIDRSYSLADLPEAIGYLEEGHARGKVVVTL